VPLLLNSMLVHAMSSSNTKLPKSVLSVNSNASVFLNKTHKLTFNNMVLNSSTLPPFFNKLVLLVLSKIS
jgi:hypothetical protein